jgi:putative peptidoglycan lipid II flippase
MSKDRFVGHANLMSVLTIVSRFAGLIRDKVCSYFIGLTPEWSAFWIGFIFPNLFRRIFGEGALTAVFVPRYTEVLHKEGPEAANKLASATVTLLILVLTGITLLGEAIALPLAQAKWVSDSNRLAAAMIAIMLPYCVMVCLVAIMGALAAVHEKFTAQSLSPIILNLFMAGAAALCVATVRGSTLTQRVYWVAASVLAAGVVQVLQMIPTLRRSGIRLRPLLQFRQAGVGEILRPLLPILLGYSAVTINTAMDSQIAWWLSPEAHDHRMSFTILGYVVPVAMGEGAVAKLSAAQRIYMLPVGIFGVSMAMAVFPPMARAASAGDMTELKRLLVAGLRKTLFLSIPASFGMILVAKPLITLVYAGGKVGPDDIDRAASAAVFFCVGIWAFEAQLVIARVFFVLKDTRTPSKIAVAMIGLNFALNMTLVWFLQEGGIALATTVAAIVQGAILLGILRRRLGRLGIRSLLKNAGLGLLATVVMVEVGYMLSAIPMPWEPTGVLVADPGTLLRAKLLTALVKLPVLVMVCAGVYMGLARYLGIGDLAEMPIVGRFFRPAPAVAGK